ncbi:Edem3 protein [Aphelenchoides bicaudatus]|nr:Edem3 protein [Aphelenchoides bicaudatus]
MQRLIVFLVFCWLTGTFAATTGSIDKAALKAETHKLFMHAYRGYMDYAFPHDELMPISCKPRIRGVTPSRGDVDDTLGNFSLTLVDSLDTLAVMGEYEEFEHAVHAVIRRVRFDNDFVVSVFETNIRMIGGLISGHLISKLVKEKIPGRLGWYDDQLLRMATDLADRLLPAFNTTSGIPHSRINLKFGLSPNLKIQSDTCTACAGTIILEWAALSRLTGNPIYEEKARKAMDFLWNQRNHGSDLMGTVLNVQSGDWVRRDAGIGAGIDSYYEYTLKAYILLGEEDYLYRFNKHYDAVMRYLNKGPLFIDVHMHKPMVASRSYMDALLAFWPGVQVIQKHKFLPEAFTHDLQIHWPNHPLRPEFLESTYLLYRATKDEHYLEVAQQVMNSMNEHCRTRCGFAAIKDIRNMEMLDEMESFVMAETFKYLYMIFAEPNDLLFDPDNYVLTTEAHFLPLSIGEQSSQNALPRRLLIDPDEVINDEASKRYQSVCPNFASEYRTLDELSAFGNAIRSNVKKLLNELTALGSYATLLTGQSSSGQTMSAAEIQQKALERLRAWAFSSTNPEHIQQLKQMGITVQSVADGKIQLIHQAQEESGSTARNPSCYLDYRAAFGLQAAADALNMQEALIASKGTLINMVALLLAFLATSPLNALHGIEFMQEMIQINKQLEQAAAHKLDRYLQLVSDPFFGRGFFMASPANFGPSLEAMEVVGELAAAEPYDGCKPIKNVGQIAGRIGITIIKDPLVQNAPLFAMSADSDRPDDISIPSLFLYNYEGQKLLNRVFADYRLIVRLSSNLLNPVYLFEEYMFGRCCERSPLQYSNDFISFDDKAQEVQFYFHLQGHDFSALSDNEFHNMAHYQLDNLKKAVYFPTKKEIDALGQLALRLLMDLQLNQPLHMDFDSLKYLMKRAQIQPVTNENESIDQILTVTCQLTEKKCQLESEDNRVSVESNVKTEL